MKRLITATIYILAACTVSQAQTYSLQQCIETGLENNYSLRITRNNEAVAHNNATLANAGYLPSIDLTAGYNAALDNSDAELRGSGEVQETRNSLDHTLKAGIGVSWTIFDGFSISTTYKQLKELERMGETGTRIAIEDLIADIAAEYYNFINQRQRLENYYRAVLLSKERLRIVVE